MKRLEGKFALVTGGGRGLGKAIVQRYVDEGAKVIAVSTGKTAAEAAAEIGPNVTPYVCDVSKPEQVEELMNFARKTYGELNILCNNAGIGHPRGMRLHDFDISTWHQVMDVNLNGAFYVLKYGIKLMLESGKGGAIVNMASFGAHRGGMFSTPYRVSKIGMTMLTKQAAVEYAKDNIRVNTVSPGAIATDIQSNVSAEETEKKLGTQLVTRLGRPEEVAAITAFLSSDEAGFITGADYVIDGGRMVQ